MKFLRKMLPVALLASVTWALGACSPNAPMPLSGPSAVIPEPTLVTKTDEAMSLSQAILTPTPSRLNTLEKPTFTPGLSPDLQSFEIESGDPRYVTAAFWSDDGKTVYFAFARSLGAGLLEWGAYDITARLTTIISSPVKYDPHVWRELNMTEPDLGMYLELQGHISPRGRRVIYAIAIDRNKSPKSEIWVADTNTLEKSKLMEVPNHGSIVDAMWLEDETRIVFRYGVETNDLYVADIQNTNGRPLADISDFKDAIGEGWSASPDGKTLAVTDFQRQQLWLVSLEDGKVKPIDVPVTYVHWAKNGKTLYYSMDTREFRSYDIASGSISTLITRSQVEDIYHFNDFSVSPNGDKVLFWGGWLRLVELHK